MKLIPSMLAVALGGSAFAAGASTPTLLAYGTCSPNVTYVRPASEGLSPEESNWLDSSTGVGGAAVLLTSCLPSIKIEWTLQVFDDVFSSTFFAFTPRVFSEITEASHRPSKLYSRFGIQLCFPVILGVTQLTIYLVGPDEYLTALYVEAVNFHFTIIGVVFATLWGVEGHWEDSRNMPSDHSGPSTIQFNTHSVSSRGPAQMPKEMVAFPGMDISIPTCTDVCLPTFHAAGGEEIKPEASVYELQGRSTHDLPA
ncbi:hypothetical protein DFH07DRAFT_769160 [Mycena maculata]|uniref:Uncharacterized protein n=1 Tax=Mycena maculata TaxID=230809 RepID=A0AAD7JQR1_9AGAR|nr:hypothetical protein DFH07DRAFT_769160 [Mycena maculata]